MSGLADAKKKRPETKLRPIAADRRLFVSGRRCPLVPRAFRAAEMSLRS
jgi:hypothetical protein